MISPIGIETMKKELCVVLWVKEAITITHLQSLPLIFWDEEEGAFNVSHT
jgi:hypothetical protein